jgi:hypothetical protein
MSYITIKPRTDGFGAQFQNIIACIIYAEHHNMKYIHIPFKHMEHNYAKDNTFLDKIEDLINLKEYYTTNNDYIKYDMINHEPLYYYLESNIDMCIKSDSMSKIRNIFWSNKNRKHFNNNFKNVAIHIRRPNMHDNRTDGTDKPDNYYIDIINKIRSENNNIRFHIYSQGKLSLFDSYINDDVILHIDEDICTTFIGLVASDILVMSASSFSYAAALLHEGIVYYLPFWHKPSSNWIIYNY